MMAKWTASVLLLALQQVSAVKLFASHYDGTINVLNFEGTSLTLESSLKTCGNLPAWLTLDAQQRMLYCSDEVFSGTGAITAVSISSDYKLTQSAKVNAPFGGVANVQYGGTDGRGFIAIAHYQSSSVSTFKLPLTSSSTPLQTFKYTMSAKGPNPGRQEAPHPHGVHVDPTGKFLFAPDLGADMIRIYSINSSTGQLTACPNLATSPGYGPRHLAFYKPATSTSRVARQAAGQTYAYVGNELANQITAFRLTYPTNGGCPTFTQTQSLSPFPNNAAAPRGSKVGEVKVRDNFLYTTNRADKSFSGNDSIATFSLSPSSGQMAFLDITSSWGTYPRTFDINKAGDLMVIGDQTTANAAIVKRDVGTGRLGQLVANLRISTVGRPENEEGLSAVVWDQ